MYTDISRFAVCLPEDNLSRFFSSLDIVITGFGTWDQEAVSRINDFMITDYEMIYLFKGQTRITYRGQVYECRPGDAVFVEPFQLYSAECVEGEKVQYMYLHFTVEPYIVQQELVEMLKGSGAPVYSGESFRSFYTMFSNMCTPQERKLEGHALLLKFALIRMMLAMVRQRRDLSVRYERPALSSEETEIVKQAVDYVQKNIDKPIKISHLAVEIGVSESKIYKSFIDILNTPPSRYFMQLKIRRASELLKSTNLTIERISFMLGFSSAFHFSKTFKDMLGVSPSYLRKRE